MSDSYKTDCACIRCKRARRDMLEVVEGPANVPGGVLSLEPGTIPGVSIRRGIPLPPAESANALADKLSGQHDDDGVLTALRG